MAILPENETYDFESRTYINPQVSLNEQNAFVDNLRNVQKTNNDQINMQTYNLGTAVPSSVGGLTGANSYFSSRYQTPQMNSLAANLRATAQAKALNDVLANEQAKMQKRYNDAYHASQVRGSNQQQKQGGVEYNDNTNTVDDKEVWLTSDGDQMIAEPNTDTGGVTGRVYSQNADGSYSWKDQSVNYSSKGVRPAGVEQLSDLFTGMYNYTITNNNGQRVELELGGWDEALVKGSDGKYYVRTYPDNIYTPVNGSQGNTKGGSKWWTV